MSEVPLCPPPLRTSHTLCAAPRPCTTPQATGVPRPYENTHPRRTPPGPWAQAYDRVLGRCIFAAWWHAGVRMPPPCEAPREHTILESHLQGYLANNKTPPPLDPTVGLCLGPDDGPKGGGAVSCK